MLRISKNLSLLLVAVLLISSLMMVECGSAQSKPKPIVTEFTLQYVDNCMTSPPKPTSSKDPYTGNITTSTIPGYHVENKSVVATIKNPSEATYYNFRWKGHFDDKWKYEPFNPDGGSSAYTLGDTFSVPFKGSTSTYSTLSLYFLPKSITPGGEIDIQVQALYGSFRSSLWTYTTHPRRSNIRFLL